MFVCLFQSNTPCEEVWSQVHTHMAGTTPLFIQHGAYISKLHPEASRSFWKKSQVTPKMLLQTKRTIRVTYGRTPPGPATQS
ncbi:hypothetical protein HanRHA438_Chr03g0111321 [Helianthus annuus]|nr:hypothetical protein HanRHA438_Chr03g0111321 [Helianthus annuus]